MIRKQSNETHTVTVIVTIILFTCVNEPEPKSKTLDDLIEDGNNAKNKNVYTDALEFNNAIIGLQAKIGIEILKIGECQDSEAFEDLISGSMKEACEFVISITIVPSDYFLRSSSAIANR